MHFLVNLSSSLLPCPWRSPCAKNEAWSAELGLRDDFNLHNSTCSGLKKSSPNLSKKDYNIGFKQNMNSFNHQASVEWWLALSPRSPGFKSLLKLQFISYLNNFFFFLKIWWVPNTALTKLFLHKTGDSIPRCMSRELTVTSQKLDYCRRICFVWNHYFVLFMNIRWKFLESTLVRKSLNMLPM